VFWGKPSRVHPQTGVVFVVGFGTIGYVMRLPPHILSNVTAEQPKVVVSGNSGQTFDIGAMGPEWRFVMSRTRSHLVPGGLRFCGCCALSDRRAYIFDDHPSSQKCV
jgi:hypothetical protein